MMWWWYPLFAVGGYLLGSVPMGVAVGRVARGIDVRNYGSGKTGFTNTLRTVGLGPAAVVLVGDLAKGVAPVILARAISHDPTLEVVGAIGAILGHDFPLYVGFRGGRGVATTFGAAAAMMPLPALGFFLLAGVLLASTRIMSIMSVVGTAIAALAVIALAVVGVEPREYAVYAVVAAALIVVQHRDNIERLRAGTEPRIGTPGRLRTPPARGAA